MKVDSISFNDLMRLAPTKPHESHPFEQSLGAGPYIFKQYQRGESKCAHCGRPIKRIFRIATAAQEMFDIGSECILNLAEVDTSTIALKTDVKRAQRLAVQEEKATKKKALRDKMWADKRAEAKATYPDELAWLVAFEGRNSFYESLQHQLHEYGGLSEKQWHCITKALNPPEPPPQESFSLAVGTTVIVTKFLAHRIGEETGLTRPHFAIEIEKVTRETQKAYQVRAKLSAQRTNHCCVCGRLLTNPNSVIRGIGPICGGYYEVDNLEALAEKLRTVNKTIEMWLPKSQIKEERPAE